MQLKKIYINGIGLISPAGSDRGSEWEPAQPEAVDDQLRCIDPNFRDFIPAPKLRRMSKILKRGNAAAKMSLQDAGVEVPDAITVGSGLGCLEDTTRFLLKMAENDEQFLNPTPFIQSTHNSVAGNIALSLQCHGHNFTFVDGGNSFESAWMDAALFLSENSGSNVLVGGIDEVDTEFHARMNARGTFWKSAENPELPIPGEGAVFLTVSDVPGKAPYACIDFMHSTKGAQSDIPDLLKEEGLVLDDLDLILDGSGMVDLQRLSTVNYKMYCGEFHTASAFGLAMAAGRLCSTEAQNALVATKWFDQNVSIFALSSC